MSSTKAEFRASSRCECQATLAADLTAEHFVVSGSAFLLRKREKAPAHSILAEHPDGKPGVGLFDIGWACPFCGRNVLRTFTKEALPRITSKPAA